MLDNIKNVLVIGNGFDIAHGLPTTYRHFLGFLGKIKEMVDSEGGFPNEQIQSVIGDKPTLNKIIDKKAEIIATYNMVPKVTQACKDVFQSVYKIVYDKDAPEDVYEKVIRAFELNDDFKEYVAVLTYFFTGNLWHDYFFTKALAGTMQGENWIDFEGEISSVVRTVEKVNLMDKHLTSSFGQNILKMMDLVNSGFVPNGLMGSGGFVKHMERDLGIFTRVLEFYMKLVEVLPIKKLDIIKKIKVDYLLSFNYTDTYTYANYDADTPFVAEENKDFIHGKVGKHNLVLGTEETLNEGACNNDVSCIRFKKYFQRINNRTGLTYKNWFQSNHTSIYVHIFGHSLSESDGDVLKYVITHEPRYVCCIKIYYYTEENHAQQIANLVKIIGKDRLIEDTGSGRIKFIDQNK